MLIPSRNLPSPHRAANPSQIQPPKTLRAKSLSATASHNHHNEPKSKPFALQTFIRGLRWLSHKPPSHQPFRRPEASPHPQPPGKRPMTGVHSKAAGLTYSVQRIARPCPTHRSPVQLQRPASSQIRRLGSIHPLTRHLLRSIKTNSGAINQLDSVKRPPEPYHTIRTDDNPFPKLLTARIAAHTHPIRYPSIRQTVPGKHHPLTTPPTTPTQQLTQTPPPSRPPRSGAPPQPAPASPSRPRTTALNPPPPPPQRAARVIGPGLAPEPGDGYSLTKPSRLKESPSLGDLSLRRPISSTKRQARHGGYRSRPEQA